MLKMMRMGWGLTKVAEVKPRSPSVGGNRGRWWDQSVHSRVVQISGLRQSDACLEVEDGVQRMLSGHTIDATRRKASQSEIKLRCRILRSGKGPELNLW